MACSFAHQGTIQQIVLGGLAADASGRADYNPSRWIEVSFFCGGGGGKFVLVGCLAEIPEYLEDVTSKWLEEQVCCAQ